MVKCSFPNNLVLTKILQNQQRDKWKYKGLPLMIKKNKWQTLSRPRWRGKSLPLMTPSPLPFDWPHPSFAPLPLMHSSWFPWRLFTPLPTPPPWCWGWGGDLWWARGDCNRWLLTEVGCWRVEQGDVDRRPWDLEKMREKPLF